MIRGDGYGPLKAVKVLPGEVERRFGQQNVDELLSDIEGQGALVVDNLRARHRRLVPGSTDPRGAFMTSLPGEGRTQVEFSDVIQRGGVEATRRNRNVQIVVSKNWVGPDGGRDLLGLALLYLRLGGLQSVIVGQSQPNRLIEIDVARS